MNMPAPQARYRKSNAMAAKAPGKEEWTIVTSKIDWILELNSPSDRRPVTFIGMHGSLARNGSLDFTANAI